MATTIVESGSESLNKNAIGTTAFVTGTNHGVGLALVRELAKDTGICVIFAGYYDKVDKTVGSTKHSL